MRKTIITTVLLALAAIGCEAALFKHSVDLADLSGIPREALLELEESEFEVFLAQVGFNTARAAERGAAGAAKAAERLLETETLDLKAAKAEVKAAKANQDGERLLAAEAVLTAAELDERAAKQFLKWKKREREAREAEAKMAATALDLAESRRDLARVELLVRQGAPAAVKYDLSDLAGAVRKRQKDHESASRKAAAAGHELEALKQEWLRLASARGALEDSTER